MSYMARLMVLLGWLLDVFSLKPLSDAAFARFAAASDPDYPVHRAIWGMLAAGRIDDARELASAKWERSRSARIGRDLIHVLLRESAYEQALAIAEEMAGRQPDVPWTRMLAGDICRFFLGDEDKALATYLAAAPSCEAAMPDVYPQAVLYKRLTSIYRRRGDEERLVPALERFYSLAPTNFHDEEFILLAEERLKRGDSDGAKEVLETGCRAMTRNLPLREAYQKMGFGEPPPIPARKTPLPEALGIARIPVKTALLTEVDGPVATALTYVKDKARPGDVVTLSSCVAAIMEGRMLMEGTIRPSFLARFLSRLIAGAHATGAFGASAPMANPLSAQAALEEVGTLRLVVAALVGAVGKLFRITGWFYVVSGPQVAQIDDILGSIPPYDYYVMMGPRDPSGLSSRIASSLGEGVEAAIIDANDLGIAWAVGCSAGVDARELERVMSDNPAGNQDQMTPLVIVRPEAGARRVEGEQAGASVSRATRALSSGALGDAARATRASVTRTVANACAARDAAARTVASAACVAKASAARLLASIVRAFRMLPAKAGAARTRAGRFLSTVAGRGAVVAVIVVVALGASTMAWADRHPRAEPVPVLLYHDITSEEGPAGGMAVPVQEFLEQMEILRVNGYSAITTGELRAYLSGRGTLPPRAVLITFDDGYESVYTLAYPVLRACGFRATAFVVGATLNTPNHLTVGHLREMAASGTIEVGWHTFAGHTGTADNPSILSWTQDELRTDFRELAAMLNNAQVPIVPAFAYPFGRASEMEVQVAGEWGFTLGFTTEEGVVSRKDPPMLLKRITIWPGNSGSRFLARIVLAS
jgi:peptidoglycan/xylan/chitin deacetylase (PgdA/CDA1 family)